MPWGLSFLILSAFRARSRLAVARRGPNSLKFGPETSHDLVWWPRRASTIPDAATPRFITQVVANASMKKQLKEIEDKILYMLSNSTGNILDDHELIETLASSKITSTEITEKVADAEVTEKEIDAYRERYRPVAYRATILYFSVVNLCVVDPMYQRARRVF